MCDEPTSGMDSFRAREIVCLLHSLARNKGKTVCSTIHQPSSEAFFYFDRLIIMCDGNIVYQGDAAKSPSYFRSIKYDMPRFANPADIFMKLLAINYPKR
jgi:ABC-type multidrug transport system ATPase subunit